MTSQIAVGIHIHLSKGKEYEAASKAFYRSGVFEWLFAALSQWKGELTQFEVIKSLEFACMTQAGLQKLCRNSKSSIEVISDCFKNNSTTKNSPKNAYRVAFKDIESLYSAATILLDLTANEEQVEQISKQMLAYHVFEDIVKDKLRYLMHPQAVLETPQLKKLKDLFMGMVLNLTCNIEEEHFIMYMVQDLDILKVLVQILID